MRFINKVAIVTGGSSGMGREAAQMLAREGATVIVADRQEEALQNAYAMSSLNIRLQLKPR